MEHYYNKLEHWFDYEDVFLEAIQKAKDGDLFVEIGVWKGGSAAFMGVEIFNSGKKLRYDAIDCFAPTKEFGKMTEYIYEEANEYFEEINKIFNAAVQSHLLAAI